MFPSFEVSGDVRFDRGGQFGGVISILKVLALGPIDPDQQGDIQPPAGYIPQLKGNIAIFPVEVEGNETLVTLSYKNIVAK